MLLKQGPEQPLDALVDHADGRRGRSCLRGPPGTGHDESAFHTFALQEKEGQITQTGRPIPADGARVSANHPPEARLTVPAIGGN